MAFHGSVVALHLQTEPHFILAVLDLGCALMPGRREDKEKQYLRLVSGNREGPRRIRISQSSLGRFHGPPGLITPLSVAASGKKLPGKSRTHFQNSADGSKSLAGTPCPTWQEDEETGPGPTGAGQPAHPGEGAPHQLLGALKRSSKAAVSSAQPGGPHCVSRRSSFMWKAVSTPPCLPVSSLNLCKLFSARSR